MYRMKPGIKKDQDRRWSLPDRVFFAYGACHILAGTYLKLNPLIGFYAERIIPGDDFAGNHIYVTDGIISFDFHGYSCRNKLVQFHTNNWSGEYSEGWHCQLEKVEFDLLCTAELNARKMLGPDQYKYDATERAVKYLSSINHDSAYKKAQSRSSQHQ